MPQPLESAASVAEGKMKVCKNCNMELALDLFYIYKSGYYYSDCKSCCKRKRVARGFIRNEHTALKARFQFHYYRDLIIQYLGAKCAYCGYNENILGLEIDHIENNGWADRTNRKGASSTMLKRWFESGCEGLQLLCGTCHNIKSKSFNMRLSI